MKTFRKRYPQTLGAVVFLAALGTAIGLTFLWRGFVIVYVVGLAGFTVGDAIRRDRRRNRQEPSA